jgi:hypothetical protein
VNLCQPAKVLTSCPACLQGLSRYRDDVGVESDYIVVELASNRLGEKWQTEFLDKVNRGLSFPRAGVGMQSGRASVPPPPPQGRPARGSPRARGGVRAGGRRVRPTPGAGGAPRRGSHAGAWEPEQRFAPPARAGKAAWMRCCVSM